LDENTVKFNLIARVQGFTGVGFSNDEKRVIWKNVIFILKMNFFSMILG
jgi:hypothetical protein